MYEALTETEGDLFDTLGGLIKGRYRDVEPALMRATLYGRDVAVVVGLHHEIDHGTVRADPVAVLVDADLIQRLTPPEPVEVVDHLT